MLTVDPFGTDRMTDALRAFCEEQGVEMPMVRLIEVDGVLMAYAVPQHLVKNDQMNQFDVDVIFLLRDFPDREDREAEACRLRVMAGESGSIFLLIFAFFVFSAEMISSPAQQLCQERKRRFHLVFQPNCTTFAHNYGK